MSYPYPYPSGDPSSPIRPAVPSTIRRSGLSRFLDGAHKVTASVLILTSCVAFGILCQGYWKSTQSHIIVAYLYTIYLSVLHLFFDNLSLLLSIVACVASSPRSVRQRRIAFERDNPELIAEFLEKQKREKEEAIRKKEENKIRMEQELKEKLKLER